MRRILVVFTLFFFCNLGYSQARKVWMYHADKFYEEMDYENALLNYKKALSDSAGLQFATIPYELSQAQLKLKDKKNMEIDSSRQVSMQDYLEHQIAMCYMRTFDYKRALEQLNTTASTKAFPEDVYYLGVAQMNMDLHKDAVETFKGYIQSEKYNDSLLRSAQLLITGCYYAQKEERINDKITVNLLDTNIFNKGTSSFAPMWFEGQNKLLFTSAREGGVIVDPQKQQSEFLCDLYWTEKNGDSWSKAVNFGRPLNSGQHDASGFLYHDPSRSNEYKVVYYTRWSDQNRAEKSIHFARMVNMMFYESYKLPESVNVPGYMSINPFVSLDGKWLFFSSNRPGGEGGLDLWKIELNETGMPVGDAINLGRPVNSELDEQTPYMHEISSTLFFSSNGHNSIGGLDIFKSTFNQDNNSFEHPVNMGSPINSSKDDAYIIWDDFMQKGYFSSDREPCEFGHCYNIYEVINEPIVIALEGHAYDIQTNEILANTDLLIKDIGYKFDPYSIKTDDDGYYRIDMEQNQDIFLKATRPKYFADAGSVSTRQVTQSITLVQDFYLDRIPEDEIELDGIEYDFDKATLRPESEKVLDKLYEFLVFNSNLIVEVNSHTDCRGSDSYNKDLSKRRAQSCVDYLLKKGVEKGRITAVGYGESQPNYLKDDKKKPVLDAKGNRIYLTEKYINQQSDEETKEDYHQRNRRTSFKVVGEGFDLESN